MKKVDRCIPTKDTFEQPFGGLLEADGISGKNPTLMGTGCNLHAKDLTPTPFYYRITELTAAPLSSLSQLVHKKFFRDAQSYTCLNDMLGIGKKYQVKLHLYCLVLINILAGLKSFIHKSGTVSPFCCLHEIYMLECNMCPTFMCYFCS